MPRIGSLPAPLAAKFREAAGVSALAGADGSTSIGFVQAGSEALPRTVRDKLRDFPISPEDFGAVGDGVNDDTAAVHAAFDVAVERNVEVRGTAGKTYRVTSGYVNSATRGNLTIRGPGRINERFTDAKGAAFLLDSTDPSSFFLQLTKNCTLTVDGAVFKCAQYVTDRKFIRMGGALQPLIGFFFYNTSFESVEKPICLESGLYFQNAALRDVQFINSGTIHSEGDAEYDNLLGTYLTLDNVNHEGSVPANTEKQVCNLDAIRLILADNFLLEGSLPETGWTILKLSNPYDAFYTRSKFATFRNFHAEWSGPPAECIVDQDGGTVDFDYLVGLTTGTGYRISNQGKAVIRNTDFSTEVVDPTTYFTLQDSRCLVEFDRCTMRKIDTSRAGFTHRSSQLANNTDGIGQITVSNDAGVELWRWRGERLSTQGDVQVYPATPCTQSTDATLGRKLVFSDANLAGGCNIEVKTHGALTGGDQPWVAGRMTLPTFAGGYYQVFLLVNGSDRASVIFDADFSGQTVDFVVPCVLLAADAPTRHGVGFFAAGLSGVEGNMEVHSLCIGYGRTVPRVQATAYPPCVTSYHTAAPSTGTHAQGDRVINSMPAVGQPKGWICTVAGTPGTWVSEGTL